MSWQSWLTIIGGILAIIGEFIFGYYLSLIGGILAVVGGIGMMMSENRF